MNIVPIDIGFGWTKGKTMTGRWFLQPSVVGDFNSELHIEDLRANDLIYDESLFVGELAIRHSDVKYFSMKGDKSTAWTTEVLLDTALGCLVRQGQAAVVTGLPVDYYFSQKDSMQEMLESRHGAFGLSCGRNRFLAHPRVVAHKIVPQPLGAAMDHLLDDQGKLIPANKALAGKRILVSDWGRYTWDVLILDGMEIHPASFSRDDMGIETAYKVLQRYLREAVGKSPARHEMDTVVLSGEYEGFDVKPLIERAFQAVIAQMMLEIEGLNMRFACHILAGGQAQRQAQYLQLENKVVGGQLSILNGYGKIGVRTWGSVGS